MLCTAPGERTANQQEPKGSQDQERQCLDEEKTVQWKTE